MESVVAAVVEGKLIYSSELENFLEVINKNIVIFFSFSEVFLHRAI
jgi:hypothetical protein